MKFLMLIVPVFIFALDYISLHKYGGKGYEGSDIYISGELSHYSCYEAKRAYDSHCEALLVMRDYDGTYLNTVRVYVGSTYQSDFKSASKGDKFSFNCTFRGDNGSFKDCR
ncbi:MAG: hypothetical protein IE909_15660 [Campylobacterales bacterium]|nr:hypothetical protein [Campylobacterales bacterium]